MIALNHQTIIGTLELEDRGLANSNPTSGFRRVILSVSMHFFSSSFCIFEKF